jgi:GNAT superfamily N-acetyltransferase
MDTSINQLEFRSQYWDHAPSKQAFMRFIRKIHGLDFTLWDDLGYWDSAYTPFSYFRGDEVIASVCIYLLEAIVDGEPAQLIQISGVGTHEAWRRKGLSRELTRRGLAWAGDTPAGVFLFSDTDAVPFYLKSGFTPSEEYLCASPIQCSKPRSGIEKMDMNDPSMVQRVFQYAAVREAISHRFSISNPKLVAFHALYTLRDCTFFIPELDCVLFFRRESATLHIYDILAPQLPPLEEILPYLCHRGDTEVICHFFMDKLGLAETKVNILEGNHFFTRDHFPVNPVVFPYTSRA